MRFSNLKKNHKSNTALHLFNISHSTRKFSTHWGLRVVLPRRGPFMPVSACRERAGGQHAISSRNREQHINAVITAHNTTESCFLSTETWFSQLLILLRNIVRFVCQKHKKVRKNWKKEWLGTQASRLQAADTGQMLVRPFDYFIPKNRHFPSMQDYIAHE